ncbi:MAG: rhodanese-like domain-containing protein [Verrucomicrobiales bacterium]
MFKDHAIWIIPLVIVIGFILFKRLGQVPKSDAVALIRDGAVMIDVRGPGEFASDHVEGAINVPLDSLEARIATVAPDKNQPVLVHCLSGTRSAFAVRTLRKLGYSQVHDLGSLGRARSLAAGAKTAE